MSTRKFAPLKVGEYGFAGTGKSRTATEIAIGLHKAIKSKLPIKIYDTERSAHFLVRIIKNAGIPFDPMKDIVRARSLTKLGELMDECEKGASDILIIDSITHVWETFRDSYLNGRKRLNFADWQTIKPTWKREYSDRLVLHGYNIIFTGRSGWEYETILDENGKISEIVKTGTKMKVEGDTAFEPDILLEFEQIKDQENGKPIIYREATVLKDRADVIDGKIFRNPTFKDFQPVWEIINSDISEMPKEDTSNDAGLVQQDEDNREQRKQKDIVLEEIWGTFDRMGLGTGAKDKQKKMEIFEEVFVTRSKSKVEAMDLETLREGLHRLEDHPEVKKLISEHGESDA